MVSGTESGWWRWRWSWPRLLFRIVTTTPTNHNSVVLALVVFLTLTPSPCQSLMTLQQGTWMYKGQYPIAYERAYHTDNNQNNLETMPPSETASPVLLLNGFGMGSFHQHRLMEAMFSDNNYCNYINSNNTNNKNHQLTTTILYGMDYLGQGKSWPVDCDDGNSDSERGLRYCGQTWIDQIIQFIEQHIQMRPCDDDTALGTTTTIEKKKVHLVGNSVGGHLAVFVAAVRPDLIESICLINVTPVWGLNLPGWSGHLPAPLVAKHVGRYFFDRMRDRSTIRTFLETTYVHPPELYDVTLVEQILATTEGPGGHAAFASILWSPPVTVALSHRSQKNAGFYDCLSAIQCDVLLVFGRDDPWCKPVLAQRMLTTLTNQNRRDHSSSSQAQYAAHRYLELSNVGHCPHHEAPQATAMILTRWLPSSAASADEDDRRTRSLLFTPDNNHKKTAAVAVQETWGEAIVQERSVHEIQLSLVDRLAAAMV